MKRLKTPQDLKKCEEKIVAFWSKGQNVNNTEPHYYEKLHKCKSPTKIKISWHFDVTTNTWNKPKYDSPDRYVFNKKKWFVMTSDEFNKRILTKYFFD